MNEEAEHWEDLVWHMRRSIRYHMRRVRFYDLWHVWTNMIGIIFGSATALTILGGLGPSYTVAASFVVSIAFMLDLFVGTARMSRQHQGLASKFIGLQAKAEVESDHQATILHRYRAEILLIEHDEPPVLRMLNDICHNEMVIAMGYPSKYLIHIPWMKRHLANIISFDPINV